MKPFGTILLIVILAGGMVSTATSQYAVGTADRTFIDPERGDRAVPVDLYYPAATAGEEAPVAEPPPEGFAAVAFGHGFQLPVPVYAWIAERLAAEGCVVALPRTAGELFPDHGEFGLDLAFAARVLRDAGDDPGSVFHLRMGPRTLVMGHSMGGGASFLAAAGDPSLTAVANFAAAETNPSAVAACGQIAVPSLQFAGANDCVTPPAENQVPMYGNLGGWKTLVTLDGASHCQFNAYSFLCEFGEFCSPDISRQEQQDRTWSLLRPWVRTVLFLDVAAAGEFQDLLAGGAGFSHLQAGLPSPVAAGPGAVRLDAAPNPFNATVILRAELPRGVEARLVVCDLRGRRVRVLEAEGPDGRAVFRWDGRSGAGRELPSGTYLARLMSGEAVVATARLSLIR